MDFPGFSLDMTSLGEGNRPDPSELFEVLILGGGPAAMTAAVYAARKMLKLAVITKDWGGQVATTSEIENYMGFQTITGEELTKKFKEQVQLFEVPVWKGEKVKKVELRDPVFHVTLEGGSTFRSKTLILATGKRSRKLGVPGEEELAGKGVAYCATCDAPFYKDKEVVVAGGGNSAATAAIDLLKVAKSITLVNFVEGWQADEVLMKPLHESSKVTLLDHHQITAIRGEERVEKVLVKDRGSGAERELQAQGLFVEIGLLPNSEPVEGLVKMTPRKEVIVDCHARTSVPGLMGAGDVTTVPFKQIVVSAGEGAKAALSAYDYLLKMGKE